LDEIGYPAVLKTDGSSGAGVANQLDAQAAFKRLARHSVLRGVKELVLNSDSAPLKTSLSRDRPRVTVQRFITGIRANAAAACYDGKVPDQVSVEVLASGTATGRSSVVQAKTANESCSDSSTSYLPKRGVICSQVLPESAL
jgi:hypothetical protein